MMYNTSLGMQLTFWQSFRKSTDKWLTYWCLGALNCY